MDIAGLRDINYLLNNFAAGADISWYRAPLSVLADLPFSAVRQNNSLTISHLSGLSTVQLRPIFELVLARAAN